jgi:sarcosine oxidase subunit beta
VRSADAIIAGAGVVSASAAYHLASRGVRRILLLERAASLGAGSTGRATGGFRAQFSTEINIRLSLLAREKLLRFGDELGIDPGYQPFGYLWLARTHDQLAQLRTAQRLQHACGLREARLVEPAELAILNPAIAIDGLAGGAFCPSDGFLKPLQILQGYLDGARRLGAQLELGTEVVGLRRNSTGSIASVITSTGEIATGLLVDAAGAWAAGVAQLAGIELPVAPLRRQVASTVPCALLPPEMPMTLFVDDGFHLRVRDGRVLLLRPTPGRPGAPFDDALEESFLEEMAPLAAQRVPLLAGVALDPARSWAGLYEMSPDKHAILGTLPACPNLFFANGSSGHGVMHAPALGQLLAELITEGRASLDVRALRPERFAEGDSNPVSELL